jgi:hypothetical protein
MTALLTQAFEKASSLPEPLQDELARLLLEEIDWEARWDHSLSVTGIQIDAMAEKALRDFRAGKASETGFDEL